VSSRDAATHAPNPAWEGSRVGNPLLLHLCIFFLSIIPSSCKFDSKMTPEYKAEKEAAVSYLGGGNIWEINHVTLVAPVRFPIPCHGRDLVLISAGCRTTVVHPAKAARLLHAI